MLKAIIFDFDGIIADTEPIHFKAFHKVLDGEAISLSTEEYYSKYLAYDDKTFFYKVLGDYGKDNHEQKIDELVHKKSKYTNIFLKEDVKLFPGFLEFVASTKKKYRLAIGSGALKSEIVFILKKFKIINSFQSITCADDVDKCKPNPEVFIKVLKGINYYNNEKVYSHECLVIEDSIYGIQAAKSAGMKCIAITNSYAKEKLREADLVVKSFFDLNAAIIEKLFY